MKRILYLCFLSLLFLVPREGAAQNLQADSLNGPVRVARLKIYDMTGYWDGLYNYLERHYDRNGVVRMIVSRSSTNHMVYSRGKHTDLLMDTIFCDAEGRRMLTKSALPDDEGGVRHVTHNWMSEYGVGQKGSPLDPKYEKIEKMEFDREGNWTRASRQEPYRSFKNVERSFVYYGDDPAADAAWDAQIDGVTSQIDTKKPMPPSKFQEVLRAMSKNFFGILFLFVVVPLIFTVLFVTIPITLISLPTKLHNWMVTLIALCVVPGFIVSFVGFLTGFDPYRGFPGEFFIWLIVVAMAFGTYKGIIHQRCPRCHHANSSVIRRIFTRTTREEKRLYPDGSEELLNRSSTEDVDEKHICHNCGYDWWTRN